MNALILGKKIVGRKETLEYAAKKFGWKDVVIGISVFYAFWAWIIARLTGRKFIYYCIDFYSPEIAYTIWDKIFIPCAMLMDRFLCKVADEIWDISERINEGRTNFGGYAPKHHTIVRLAYPPTYFHFVPPRPLKTQKKPIRICYVGLEKYGLELLWSIKDITDLDFLGGKPYLPIDELLLRISNYDCGISLWKDKGNNYYGDPGKTKLYSACGLPVIMTDNTPYTKIIRDTQAGVICEYNEISLRKAIKEMIFNYDFYKRNVKDTWKFINVDNVYANLKILGR